MHMRPGCFLPPCSLFFVIAVVLCTACSTATPAVVVEQRAATSVATPEVAAVAASRAVGGAVTIGAVGDLMFARDITTLMQGRAGYPFERVLPLLSGVDLLIGNFEGTFTDRGTPIEKMYAFRTPPELAGTLASAGFNAVSLGNNHAVDFGAVGILDTMNALRGAGVLWFGAGADESQARAPLLLEAGGYRVALLGYSGVGESVFATGSSAGVARASAVTILSDVERARGEADFVIVVIHAGIEYTRQPSAWQRELAHAAIDAGADVVIGHHPHVLQPWERYGDGLILYSLGNFVFDLDTDDLATLGSAPFETAVAVITLTPDAPPEVEFRPAYIDPIENRPRPTAADEAAGILGMLQELRSP